MLCVPIVRPRVWDGSALRDVRAASVVGDVGILKLRRFEEGLGERRV
jgi:hypothetical protein